MRPDIALAGWAGGASVHTLEQWFRRDFCVTERSCAAAILEVDRHISDRFLCHFLARYEQVFILWKLIAFHVDMIPYPVLCWLSLKEASVEERTMILHKVLIALFLNTWQNFHRIYMKKELRFFVFVPRNGRLDVSGKQVIGFLRNLRCTYDRLTIAVSTQICNYIYYS